MVFSYLDSVYNVSNANITACNATTLSPRDYTAYLTMVSSCFSMMGSALIIITFIIWKDIRTVARAIVVFLAIADFFTAAGYLFGSIVSYLHERGHYGPNQYKILCETQSFVTTAFPISSFLWTSYLAIYLYMAIVHSNPILAKKLLVIFHITGWGVPLAICLPAILTGHLGSSNDETSVNWCFVSLHVDNPENKTELNRQLAEYYGFELLCGKFWEITTYFVALVLYITVKVVLKRRTRQPIQVVKSVTYGSINIERKMAAAMIQLDQKLIFIPLIFIFLRIWGTLRFFISFLPSCHEPCGDFLMVVNPCKQALYNPFLMVMQAIGDPGQGWGNALIFVVFHKTLAKRLCPCIFFIGDRIKRHYRESSEQSSVPAVDKESRDPLLRYEEDGHQTPTPVSDEEGSYRKQVQLPPRSQISTHL